MRYSAGGTDFYRFRHHGPYTSLAAAKGARTQESRYDKSVVNEKIQKLIAVSSYDGSESGNPYLIWDDVEE